MRTSRTRHSTSGSNSDGERAGSSNSSAYPLLRGTACLSCRKRKMKCDAVKPACNQCTKANRPHDCEYDDGKTKSRTQVMQEKILKQEQRIRELETFGTTASIVAGVSHLSPNVFGGQQVSSPGFFDDPLARSHSPFFGSVSPQPALHHAQHDIFAHDGGLMNFGALASTSSASDESSSPPGPSNSWAISDGFDFALPIVDPVVQGPAQPPADLMNAGLQQPQPIPLSHAPAPMNDASWPMQPEVVPTWESEDIPMRTREMLLDIFLKHTHQCGLVIHVPRFLKNIHLPLSNPQRPHAALLNAMFLLAAKFSANPSLRQFESRFISRATEAIAAALERSDRLVNIVQAECLLAFYFYSSGRLLEGFMHASGASRLAVGLDLHKITSVDPTMSRNSSARSAEEEKQQSMLSNPATSTSAHINILSPPVDSIELGERINAFWMAFNVDRAWAVATGMPVAFTDGEHVRTQVETVWPRGMTDFETGNVTDAEYASLKDLYPVPQGGPPPKALGRPESYETLRSKAIALFERASRLSAGLSNSRGVNDAFWTEFRNVEFAIRRFSQSLPSVRSAPPPQSTTSPSLRSTQQQLAVDQNLAFIHTLAYVAMIQLHHVFAYMDATSHERCLAAAGGALAVLRDLGEADARMLDPILGTAWMCVADTLVRELVRLKSMPGSEMQADSVGAQLHAIVGAMKQLSEVFPICGYQVSRVQEARLLA